MPRHWSETTAQRYLLRKGYKLLAENYAIRSGELDLVMQDGEVVVFIEVRQRKTSFYGSAAESLTPAKLARLRKVALYYLVQTYKNDALASRFDAVLIQGEKHNYSLEHLKNIA